MICEDFKIKDCLWCIAFKHNKQNQNNRCFIKQMDEYFLKINSKNDFIKYCIPFIKNNRYIIDEFSFYVNKFYPQYKRLLETILLLK